MNNPDKLFVTTALALVLASVGGQTLAQDLDGDAFGAMEQITVTGSFIRRQTDAAIGSPVDVFDRTAIEADGPGGKISDFLRFIPANVGAFNAITSSQPENNFGGSSINLRGLGAGATLTLVNGRRMTRFPLAEDGRVDANTLAPTIMIERVEILKDGASSIYGTDAVAGVVNFITRDDYEGIELDFDVRGTTGGSGSAEFWDYAEYTVGFLAGTDVGEDTHIVAGVEYVNISPLQYADRDAVERAGTGTATQQFKSSFGNPGNYIVPIRDVDGTITGSQIQADPDCQNIIDAGLGGSHAFFADRNGGRGECRYGLTNSLEMARKEERWLGTTRITHDFSEHLRFKGGFTFSKVATTNRGNATTPVNVQPTVPGENPGNPFRAVNANGDPLFAVPDPDDPTRPLRDDDGAVVLTADPTNPATGIAFNEDVIARFRPVSDAGGAPGERVARQRNESRTFRVVAGLDGAIDDNWTYDVGFTLSNTSLTFRQGDSDRGELIEAFNGRGGDGRDAFFNPFGNALFADPGDPNFNEPDVVDRITAFVTDVHETNLWSLDGVVSGDLFDLPAGPLAVAFGGQYRKERLSMDFDALKTTGRASFYGLGDQDFRVQEDVWAVFGEVLIPVIDDDDLGSLEVSGAVRFEQTTSDLDSVNPKVSLSYVRDLVQLRGSWSTSFLAPSLFQRFGNRTARQRVTDAISGIVNEFTNAPVVGSPDLEPQESTSYNVGVTITPTDTLELSVDYWNFDFDDLLAVPTAQSIIDANPFDPRIERDANNLIVSVDRPFFNAASVEVDGIDVAVNYAIPTDRYGEFVLSANLTWNFSYDLRASATGDVIDGIGRANDDNFGFVFPEWKTNVRLGWSRNDHYAQLTGRYISDVTNRFDDTAGGEIVIDALYSYTLERYDTKFTVGVINLFDGANDIIASEGNFFIDEVQDPIGRRVFASINKKF